ncbi:hypothetical protein [Amphritea sp. 2_MG-2023]|uniref:hypothetical protein n=1 Tax=Amphritea sp. 2_MG-2023 TaxID=3062682 RepID=UPI0026E20F01|nr:hypothetical protein [Amphritea sp. 2_MG-2023]
MAVFHPYYRCGSFFTGTLRLWRFFIRITGAVHSSPAPYGYGGFSSALPMRFTLYRHLTVMAVFHPYYRCGSFLTSTLRLWWFFIRIAGAVHSSPAPYGYGGFHSNYRCGSFFTSTLRL